MTSSEQSVPKQFVNRRRTLNPLEGEHYEHQARICAECVEFASDFGLEAEMPQKLRQLDCIQDCARPNIIKMNGLGSFWPEMATKGERGAGGSRTHVQFFREKRTKRGRRSQGRCTRFANRTRLGGIDPGVADARWPSPATALPESAPCAADWDPAAATPAARSASPTCHRSPAQYPARANADNIPPTVATLRPRPPRC